MITRSCLIAVIIASTVVRPVPAAAESAATGIDPHQLYEQKCRGCHSEHGADLSRQKFTLTGDALRVSRSGVLVPTLLGKHHGVQLTKPETEAMLGLFKSGIRWAGVFQHRCSSCHDKAATFARSKLTLTNGRVTSKSNSADIEDFLARHGEATPAESKTLIEMFRYQLRAASK